MSDGGYEPVDIMNQALDQIGWPDTLGDPEDGSRQAQVLLRSYRECLKQLLRAAHWDFARKSAPLTLLADATGQTFGVGSVVPNPQFTYEYAYPVDCVRARFVPQNRLTNAVPIPSSNIYIPPTLLTPVDPNAPLAEGLPPSPIFRGRVIPARFLIATDYNYPPPSDPIPWDQPGISPEGRTVILTNVPQAQLVYTAMMLYPSNWDPSFRAAFVAYLAAEVALPIWSKKDIKTGMALRQQQFPIVRDKVMEARANSGNEGVPQSTDIRVDWMDTRRIGGYGGGANFGFGGGDDGILWGGWDQLSVAGSAVF